MKYRTYELLNTPKYIDEYCVDLDPGGYLGVYAAYTTIHNVEMELQRAKVYQISSDATANFNADALGSRLFFKSDEAREKFLTWYVLRWT